MGGKVINIRGLKLSLESMGMLSMCLYIFFSYVAQDIFFSSKYNSYTLYAFLAWGVLYTFVRSKWHGFKLTTYTLWYLLFIITSFITMFYSPEFSLLTGEFYLMLVSLCLTYVIQLVVVDKKDFESLCWIYVISALFFVGILYLTGNLTATASNRLGGDIVGNANTFAGMIMVAVIYGLWLIVYGSREFITKIFLFAMVVFNMYSLVLSGGRKYFLVPFVFLYILLIFRTDTRGKRKIIKYTIFSTAIAGIAYYLIMNVPQFYELMGYRMQFVINSFVGRGEIGASAVAREMMRELAMTRWLESPLWGYGFDSFKYYAESTIGKFVYSHSNYTELLHNGGIIYFIIYYYIFYKLIKVFMRNKNKPEKYRAYALAVLICMLVFDYGAVSYSLARMHIMLALAFRVLTFSEDKPITERPVGFVRE